MTDEERIQECISGYLDGYCKKHECSREVAKTHLVAKLCIESYYDVNKPKTDGLNRLAKTELDIGCKGGC